MRTYRHFLSGFSLFVLFAFHAFAQDSITFTWKGGVNKQIDVNSAGATVFWGDGSTTNTVSATMQHTYADTNGYTVSIVANVPYIMGFRCSGNQVSSLDVSKAPSLVYLDCFYNQLSHLDVSENPNLRDLLCFGNKLSSLDLSKNTVFKVLECQNNQLNSLILGASVTLERLYCNNNQLLLSDLYAIGLKFHLGVKICTKEWDLRLYPHGKLLLKTR